MAGSDVRLVERDTICLGCGYNLRGLAVAAQCPECGEAVERSLRGNLLRHADRTWLKRVRLGLGLAYGAVIALVVLVIGMIVMASLFTATRGGGGAAAAAFGIVSMVAGAALVAAWIAYPVGWVLATRPDPAESGQRARRRIALRATALLLVPAYVLWSRAPSPGGVLPGLALPPILVELLALACFGVVWLHGAMIASLLVDLYDRCQAESAGKHAKRRRTLGHVRWQQTWLPVPIVVLHVAIVTATERGAVTMAPLGRGLGTGIGPVLVTLLLLSTMSAGGTVLRAVGRERRAMVAEAT